MLKAIYYFLMVRFPDNKRFAFTIFDDTDHSTVENVGPVYRLLADLGFRTTKSVWPLPSVESATIGGSSLADPKYLEFVRWLQQEGFELSLHNVRNHDSVREVVENGLSIYKSLVGQYPSTHCNHFRNRENLYWGVDRLSNPVLRRAYNAATRFRRARRFEGHLPGSPYFWGDICKERITYVRNFVFDEINLLNVNPSLPYHDPHKPYVNFWFSSSEGANINSFNHMLHKENQDRLEAEGGVCIMYTHFANGFVRDERIDSTFRRLLERLALKDGWFVPVATLLDYLRSEGRGDKIPRAELLKMEARWFISKLRKGTT
jgi:hypothetical protein